MKIDYAHICDRQELLDFLLTVFKGNNPDHSPFEVIYPDLFAADDEVLGRHAVIREDGRIVSCVGTYPMLMQVGGCRIMTAGVGQVATLKSCTGKGYMTQLLNHELVRCRDEGCAIAWLGGRRDRYAHFGFELASLSYDYGCDAHSLRHLPSNYVVSRADATDPASITEEMFELRDRTVNSVIEPLPLFKTQMHRLGFTFEIWSASITAGAAPEAWAVVDVMNKRIEEWCGSLEGRLAILRAAGTELGRVHKVETIADKAACDALRESCLYFSPLNRHLAILDRDGLLSAAAPLLPADFKAPPETLSPLELVRSLFGPDPGCSACIPFAIPGIFHV